MRSIFTIVLFVLSTQALVAQVRLKTIVPQEPVTAGESFQVQYIVEEGEENIKVNPPAFNGFRFVTGPVLFRGSVATINGPRPLYNTVFTLEALQPGKFKIAGASITVNGTTIRSNSATIEVISPEEATKRFKRANVSGSSDYFLRPGEDPYQKIRQNLFVKVSVDKRNCIVGQPVLATYKLYSRLESRSDIIKNPGFYGFTVYDMVNLADKEVKTENFQGRPFDVHTIRKVQLYPLQAGVFTIDPMEVKNTVEFSKSAVNKKAEQEIIEGIYGQQSTEKSKEGMEVFETAMSTEPISITVKPVPEKSKPSAFTGAVGHFSIKATVSSDKVSKNEQGFLEIAISGKGNFIQLSAPSIIWPDGIEGFEPTVKDTLDKTTIPLNGSRVFRFPFVSAKEGTVQLPVVSFSFFDTDSNQFKTISTKGIQLNIGEAIQAKQIPDEKHASISDTSERAPVRPV